jgi:acetyl esterase/lipase
MMRDNFVEPTIPIALRLRGIEHWNRNNMRVYKAVAPISAIVALFLAAAEAEGQSYVQHKNVVYSETDGIGLLMDVFKPKEQHNGLGIVDVISGAWHSDRGKIRDHARAQTFEILCARGYTVFAVRPGSITKFSVPEMVANVKEGIRWVKARADEHTIDPERLGLMGASAGGHVACLAAVTAEIAETESDRSDTNADARVKAVGVFFPVTDLLDFNGKAAGARADDDLSRLARRLAYPNGRGEATDEEVAQVLTGMSPARMVNSNAPPFLLIHGDADPVVPLQQSELMLAALKKAGVPAELIVKKGGGHPWLTIHEEVKVLADWFDKQLAAE